jgi:hypothetical protein
MSIGRNFELERCEHNLAASYAGLTFEPYDNKSAG